MGLYRYHPVLIWLFQLYLELLWLTFFLNLADSFSNSNSSCRSSFSGDDFSLDLTRSSINLWWSSQSFSSLSTSWVLIPRVLPRALNSSWRLKMNRWSLLQWLKTIVRGGKCCVLPSCPSKTSLRVSPSSKSGTAATPSPSRCSRPATMFSMASGITSRAASALKRALKLVFS